MNDVFKQLLTSIKKGSRVSLLSEYSVMGVKRSLVHEEDEAWDKLERDEEGLCLKQSEGGLLLIEHYMPKPRLIILGGGHIALPLSRVAAILGFRIVVFDDRPSFANEGRFPDAETVVCEYFGNVSGRLGINKNDYVIIVTRGHRHDSLCLRAILRGEFPRYVGMIGSQRRVAIVKKQLEKETGEAEKLSRLHAPIGLAIGAITPEEISISIIAEVIKEMRLGPVVAKDDVPKKPMRFLFPDTDLLEWLANFVGGINEVCGSERVEKAALATVVETEGSTPREAGAKMAILPAGQIIGSIGGGCLEVEVIRKAIDIIRVGGYCLVDIDLTDAAEEDGMVCGGSMKVLIEAI